MRTDLICRKKDDFDMRVDFDCDMFHIYNCIHFLLHQVLLTFLSNSRIDGHPKILECRKNAPIIPYIKAELFIFINRRNILS